jgi:hypothetical protein
VSFRRLPGSFRELPGSFRELPGKRISAKSAQDQTDCNIDELMAAALGPMIGPMQKQMTTTNHQDTVLQTHCFAILMFVYIQYRIVFRLKISQGSTTNTTVKKKKFRLKISQGSTTSLLRLKPSAGQCGRVGVLAIGCRRFPHGLHAFVGAHFAGLFSCFASTLFIRNSTVASNVAWLTFRHDAFSSLFFASDCHEA